MQFTPLKDFHSEEFNSDYCVGLSYTARSEDAKLRALLPTWIGEKKVRLGAPDVPAGSAKVSGSGEVQTIGRGGAGLGELKILIDGRG